MSTAALLIVLALALLALLLATRPGTSKGPPAGRSAERYWEEKILRQTRGNRGALERALTARRRRYPHASRAELLEMIHDEYVRDRAD
ncbi:hypothetical protein DAERI_030320 [Deinococcus aerius]|uniref:Uncharacterized protein n=1 Tax=Deinococcus aerius TaxID=200253 RepID=A0A2I9CTP4_9DEIO|nr:hypothetical protein [Deinococcus aerius]GBF05154.1 hypothetical protein DAERI_030320 [Deinococcus aerius]